MSRMMTFIAAVVLLLASGEMSSAGTVLTRDMAYKMLSTQKALTADVYVEFPIGYVNTLDRCEFQKFWPGDFRKFWPV